ncbi:hypothetical protein [Tannerella forsythia]|uniref:hypothetical protein n=1 Tax=Tannerella forsythia TaxID=28112 RepID=UPI000764AEF6|nr:hypothetical protein [Tannerella forsythia]
MKANKWDLAWMVLGAALCIVACVTLVVCVVEIAVKQPVALLGALFCCAALFIMLGNFIEVALEIYKNRKKNEKQDEKV